MGKTTLLRTLIGQLPTKAGKVTFRGIDLTRFAASPTCAGRLRLMCRKVGVSFRTFPCATICAWVFSAHRATSRQSSRRSYRHSLAWCACSNDRAARFQGGEQQVAVAGTLPVRQPGADPARRADRGHPAIINEEIGETLQLLKSAHGLTVIVVEQNLEFLASISDRMLRMHKGTVSPVTDIDRIKEEAFAEPAH